VRLLEGVQKCECHALGAEVAEQAVLTAASLDPDFCQTLADTGQEGELRSSPFIPSSTSKMLELSINFTANLAILRLIPCINQVTVAYGHITPEGPYGHSFYCKIGVW
jgi:hypothetical protein